MATNTTDWSDVGRVQTFSCIVGDVVKLCCPKTYRGMDIGGSYINGFRVLYSELGHVEAYSSSDADYNCVKYFHEKSGQQVIEFIEDMYGGRTYMVMDTVPLHDHGSLAMGGPAFATYFTERDNQEGS